MQSFIKGPCTDNEHTNTSLCILNGAMSFIESNGVGTINDTGSEKDISSNVERAAIMAAIADMGLKIPIAGIQSIQYVGPPLRNAQINSYNNTNSRLAIISTVILIPLCGIAIIFFFSKIFANDQRQAAVASRGIIQRNSLALNNEQFNDNGGEHGNAKDSLKLDELSPQIGLRRNCHSTTNRKLCVIMEEDAEDLHSSSAQSSAFS